VINYLSVGAILQKYPTERQYYMHLWWVTLTLPIYMFICSWIRLIGIINAMTTKASWKMLGFNQEMSQLVSVVRDDIRTVREQHRRDKEGK